MPQISPELVEPLVAHQEVRGTAVQVTFRCPVSGRESKASAPIQQGLGSRTKNAVGRSLFGQMRWALASMIGSMVGGGTAGYVARSVAHSAIPMGSGAPRSFAPEEVTAAVLEAFRRVQGQFAWDGTSGRFVSVALMRDLQPAFHRLVQSVEIAERWDRTILARMLAEIAAADGTVADAERAFFDAFADTDAPSLDQLLASPPVGRAELDEVTPRVREVLLLLSQALAYSDEDLGEAERGRLEGFRSGLGIRPQRAAELEGFAREYVVDQLLEAIYADGVADPNERAQVAALAGRVGVDDDGLARLEARCRKRKGLV